MSTIIKFPLSAETLVTNKTVKLTASLLALIDGTSLTEANLEKEVTAAMQALLPADWSISATGRYRDHQSGYEMAGYSASVRVAQHLNAGLEDRRTEVNRKGLNIQSVSADFSIPTADIEAAMSKLRLELMQKAFAEAKTFNPETPPEVIEIDFTKPVQQDGSKQFRAYANASASAAPGGGDDSLGNTERLQLSAIVMLEMH